MPSNKHGVSFGRRVWRRVWPFAISIATLLFAVGGILVGVHPDHWGWLTSTWYGKGIFAILIAVWLIGTYITVRDVEAVADLKDKVDQLTAELGDQAAENSRLRDDNRELFETNLRHLATDLGFGYQERVTVYEYTDEGFQSIGRYSINQNLKRPGRKACPTNEGVIGLAWDGKPSFVDDLPDANANLETYCMAVEKACQIPRHTCRNFKMKSRCLYGHCILDALGDGPVAVIVFESLTPGRLDPGAIQAALLKEENRIKSYLEQRRTAPLTRKEGRNG